MNSIKVKYRLFHILGGLAVSAMFVFLPFLPPSTKKPKGRALLGALIASLINEILSISIYLRYFLLGAWVLLWSIITISLIYRLLNRTAFIASPEGIWVHFYGFISWNAITAISYGEDKYYRRRQGMKFEQFITIAIVNPSQNIIPLTINDRLRACIFSFPSQIKLNYLTEEPRSLISLLCGMRRKYRSLIHASVENYSLHDAVSLTDVQTKITIVLLSMFILGIVLKHGGSDHIFYFLGYKT